MPMKGFTLIELLIVVAILSAVAMVSIGLMSEDRAQIRIDDTRNRLAVLRRAVLGVASPAYGGEMRLSGFVADNGRLLTDIHELLGRELLDADDNVVRTLVARAGVVPNYHDTVDSECVQTGSGTPLDAAARLLKGHRGNYLAGAAHNGAFRDGWGNVGQGDDAINFGWTVQSGDADNNVTFTSLGADNNVGATTTPAVAAEDDQAMSIADAEWRVPLDGWQVTVSNASSDAAPISISGLSAQLLVFENTPPGGRWRQFKANGAACPGPLASGESCALRYVANADGEIECDSPANSIEARVPLGRHVLVVSADVTDTVSATVTRRIVRQVDFYPGALPPNLTLEVRQ